MVTVIPFVGAVLGLLSLMLTRLMLKSRTDAQPECRLVYGKFSPLIWVLSFAAVSVGIYLLTGDLYECFMAMMMLTVCCCIAVTDQITRKIPNAMLLTLVFLRIVMLVAKPDLDTVWSSLAGAAIAGVVFVVPKLFGMPVGAGDIKFAIVVGFCLGTWVFLEALMIMALGMSIYGMWLVIRKLGNFRTKAPMGPYLALGLMITLLFPLF